MAGASSENLIPNTGLSRYRCGRAKMEISPEVASDRRAHHVHGINRRVSSLAGWLGSARPSTLRSTSTTDPITAATLRIWTVWMIGANPRTLRRSDRVSGPSGLAAIAFARSTSV